MIRTRKRTVAIVNEEADPPGPAETIPPGESLIVEGRHASGRSGTTSIACDPFRLYLAAANSGFM